MTTEEVLRELSICLEERSIETLHFYVDKKRHNTSLNIMIITDEDFVIGRKFDYIVDAHKNWNKLMKEDRWELGVLVKDQNCGYKTIKQGNLKFILSLFK